MTAPTSPGSYYAPNWYTGYVPTPAEWRLIWSNKIDGSAFALTPGSVMFSGPSSTLGESTSFFWDNTNLRLGLGTNVPLSTLDVRGSFGLGAPVTKTADYTVAATENTTINNKTGSTCTVTLPAATTSTGRILRFINWQAQTVVSASANVVPLAGGAASTAMLAATAGKWIEISSNGTAWQIVGGN